MIPSTVLARWLLLSLVGGGTAGALAAARNREQQVEDLAELQEELADALAEEDETAPAADAEEDTKQGSFLWPRLEELSPIERILAHRLEGGFARGVAMGIIPGIFVASVLASKKLVSAWLRRSEEEKAEEATKSADFDKRVRDVMGLFMFPIGVGIGASLLASAIGYAVAHKYFSGKIVPDYQEAVKIHRMLSRVGGDIPVEITSDELAETRQKLQQATNN